jgi:DNA-directed RNA polymerase specialized sigma24 family protein
VGPAQASASAQSPASYLPRASVSQELFDSGQMPDDSAEILQGEADGVPHEQIAAEIGASKTVVDNRLFRMRARFRARLVERGMLPEGNSSSPVREDRALSD